MSNLKYKKGDKVLIEVEVDEISVHSNYPHPYKITFEDKGAYVKECTIKGLSSDLKSEGSTTLPEVDFNKKCIKEHITEICQELDEVQDLLVEDKDSIRDITITIEFLSNKVEALNKELKSLKKQSTFTLGYQIVTVSH